MPINPLDWSPELLCGAVSVALLFFVWLSGLMEFDTHE